MHMTSSVGARPVQKQASDAFEGIGLADLISAGLARPACASMRELPAPFPVTPGQTLAQILADQRAAER